MKALFLSLSLACALGPSCRSSHSSATTDGSASSAGTGVADAGGLSADGGAALRALATAEDERRLGAIEEGWETSGDVRVRRRALRALARIAEPAGDARSEAALLRGLGDEDLAVVGWAAYGLGWSCKGREDAHVRALAAREATLALRDGVSNVVDAGALSRGRDSVDAEAALLRAIGRCGGTLAEGVLTGFVRAAPSDTQVEAAAYGIGSLAARHALSDETLGALLDRAGGDVSRAPAAAALYPIGRLEKVPEAWGPRVVHAAQAVLEGASPLRGFAIRALEKAGVLGVSDLARAATSTSLVPAERAAAARSLARLGVGGHEAAAGALVRLLKDHALLEADALSGDEFNVLVSLVDALGAEAPKSAEPTLYTLAALPLPGAASPLSLRVVTLRCAAAAELARTAYDAPVLTKCDPDAEGEAGQRARLSALLRRPIAAERRKVFHALATSPHVRVREAALEAIAQHPELDEAGRALLVRALSATEAGVVATAAQTIVQHPERVQTLSAAEKRAALDPRAPPPTAHPAMDLPADVSAALSRALARDWRADAVETQVALLDAAVAVSLPDARAAATRACTNENVTMREHAVRALRALGNPSPVCTAPTSADAGAPSSPELAHDTRVRFEIAGKKLGIVFEPSLTPLAAARFVALARAGFYRSVVVHRVVPGYVVQFGDPGADGYGGSGSLLRCETSPVPFGTNDVGVALAGRDTGSSQVFVTLARYPHLDGEYARVGRAEGDWDAIAEGDVIESVAVEE